MAPGTRLEFFFDYGSPYSYVADTQLEGLARRSGATLVYRPMLLGGVFKATGNQSPALEPVEPKRRHGGVELRRRVEEFGIPFEGNPHFPIDTLRIMRACVAAQREGVFESYHRALYLAFWVEGLDLGDEAILRDTLERAGLDGRRLLELAAEPEVKAELRATTEEAVERGAFGAPTFFIGDEMWFGADRLRWIEERLTRPGTSR